MRALEYIMVLVQATSVPLGGGGSLHKVCRMSMSVTMWGYDKQVQKAMEPFGVFKTTEAISHYLIFYSLVTLPSSFCLMFDVHVSYYISLRFAIA